MSNSSLVLAGFTGSRTVGPCQLQRANLLTQILGSEPVRLPRPADLLPPALAQRLLSYAGPDIRVTTLPPRRVAGVDAARLRLAPAGSTSTISAVDVWADPRTGLAVEVEILGRDSTTLNSAATVSPYLPTRYWLSWIDFRAPILWRPIDQGYAIQGVYVLVFLAAAWANFATKDITS